MKVSESDSRKYILNILMHELPTSSKHIAWRSRTERGDAKFQARMVSPKKAFLSGMVAGTYLGSYSIASWDIANNRFKHPLATLRQLKSNQVMTETETRLSRKYRQSLSETFSPVRDILLDFREATEQLWENYRISFEPSAAHLKLQLGRFPNWPRLNRDMSPYSLLLYDLHMQLNIYRLWSDPNTLSERLFRTQFAARVHPGTILRPTTTAFHERKALRGQINTWKPVIFEDEISRGVFGDLRYTRGFSSKRREAIRFMYHVSKAWGKIRQYSIDKFN